LKSTSKQLQADQDTHELAEVSCFHGLEQFLWSRGEVGGDSFEVVIATIEPGTLALNGKGGGTLLYACVCDVCVCDVCM